MPENNQILSVEGQLVGMPLAGPESFSQQQLDYLKRALGVDETVLWEGEALTGVTLSESLTNFEAIKVVYAEGAGSTRIGSFITEHFDAAHLAGVGGGYYWEDTSEYPMHVHGINLSISGNAVSVVAAIAQCFSVTNNAFVRWDIDSDFRLLKVIGIHRIAGGN